MWASYGGDVALEDPRAGGALAALDRDQVLERDRDAEQRVESVDGASPSPRAAGEPGVGGVGLLERGVAVDREPGVERVVVALGGVEVGLGELARAHLAGSEARGHLVGVEAGQAGHAGPLAAAEDRRHDDEVPVASPAALPRTASTGSDSRATSSRRMFSSSIVWAVGGMSSVSSRAKICVLVDDVVQLALERGQLVVGQPEAGQIRDVLDVGSGEGGHGPMIAEGLGHRDRARQDATVDARLDPVTRSHRRRSRADRPSRRRPTPSGAPVDRCL